ncbi:hypothetical protein K470DRAFT_219169 [Piedraia hortae CBS 480.64]|uniref:Putative phospholipase n=1 Tax=Piedraia hortae CBS 480.64 TaxID=1314780 RepID=A0A6A7BWJ6_9PEZI|nr:hypothetical protein K470DRAFT_219169 [Piedraia hortae CBS 480.64]
MLPWVRRHIKSHLFLIIIVLYILSLYLKCTLPPYPGPYTVGTIDIEVPISEPRLFSNTTLKSTNQPAFKLESVLFTLFYPATEDLTPPTHHKWMTPISGFARGYRSYLRLPWILTPLLTLTIRSFVSSTLIPAGVNLPLHGTRNLYHPSHQPLESYPLPPFPVIIFSHGTSATRSSYTHLCGSLASRGYIVAALEHRDGSAPYTLIHTNPRYPIFAEHLSPPLNPGEVKEAQLAFREAEVNEVLALLSRIGSGEGGDIAAQNFRGEGHHLAAWEGRVGDLIIAGHSFGGTLALQLSRPPFVGGVVLDPGKTSGPLNEDVTVPILVVNSEAWSRDDSHFKAVRGLVLKAMDEGRRFAWFLTARGMGHASFTDASVLVPRLIEFLRGGRGGPQGVGDVVVAFVRGLEDGIRRGVLGWDVGPPDGEWEVHVAPSTMCPYPGLCGVEP